MENEYFEDVVKSERIIYTPSVFAKTNLIYLQEIGKLQALKPHKSSREKLYSYLFIIVESGSGTLFYNNKEYKLAEGNCAFIDCSKKYFHSTTDDLWALKWFHFYGSNMSGIYEKYLQRGGKVRFGPADIDKYNYIFEEIYNCAVTESYIKDMKIYEKIVAFLAAVMGENQNSGQKKISKKKLNLQEIKDYIDSHYGEKLTLDTLEKKFFLNKCYMTRAFKVQFGITINNYILRVRITKAKYFLRFTCSPIREIAENCGFDDANYFSRIFKKIEGCSPSEFKNMW